MCIIPYLSIVSLGKKNDADANANADANVDLLSRPTTGGASEKHITSYPIFIIPECLTTPHY